MSYTLELLPEVEFDIHTAYNWYNEKLDGLGEDFLITVEAALSFISRNPLSNEIEYKSIRKARTKRFPFGVFYILDSKTITVIAIIHLSRHPKTWKVRKKKN